MHNSTNLTLVYYMRRIDLELCVEQLVIDVHWQTRDDTKVVKHFMLEIIYYAFDRNILHFMRIPNMSYFMRNFVES